jgi:uncharacterized membrane protein
MRRSDSLPSPRHSPVVDENPELAQVVHRNIRALLAVRQEFEQRKGLQERIADGITRFTGSLRFVYIHAILFGSWLLINVGLLPIVKPFDPFPFVMLAMIASVEAIFLSTFVLISQNRMAALADKRADLDLQINLLAEHEITRLVSMVDAVVCHLGIQECRDPEVEQLKRDVAPEVVLQEIAESEEEIEEAMTASKAGEGH